MKIGEGQQQLGKDLNSVSSIGLQAASFTLHELACKVGYISVEVNNFVNILSTYV